MLLKPTVQFIQSADSYFVALTTGSKVLAFNLTSVGSLIDPVLQLSNVNFLFVSQDQVVLLYWLICFEW